jgi:hypothetical protein
VAVGAVAAFVGGTVVLVFGMMKHTDAYGEALSRARESVAVRQALGEPIEPGFFVWGSVNVQLGGTGTASLTVPLAGPKGRGTLYVRAARSEGRWRFLRLTLVVAATGEEIDLLAEGRQT